MKQLNFIIVALCAIVLTACSSDEPQYKVDNDVVEAYRTGAESRCYKFEYLVNFVRENPNAEWKSNGDIDCDYVIFERILFKDGNVMALLNLAPFRGSVYSECRLVQSAFQKVTGDNTRYYVSIPFSFNSETNIMKIGYGCYTVKEMTQESLILDDYVPSLYDADTWVKAIFYYKAYEIPESELEQSLSFATEKDAMLDIVKKARDYFGNTIDLNEIYKPNIIYDDPIIDLNKLEEMIYEEFGD